MGKHCQAVHRVYGEECGEMKPTLSKKEFSFVVRSTPVFALDLVMQGSAGSILLGMRENSPARGFWFVPGGRVFKNESLPHAALRILANEVGVEAHDLASLSLLGLYEHIYEDNVFGDPGFNTHYIVGAYVVRLKDGVSFKTDAQHKEFRVFAVDELMRDTAVHPFVKNYFLERAPNRLACLDDVLGALRR